MGKKVLSDHRRLTRLFTATKADLKTLGQIEETLEEHIRFDEGKLFNHIQQVATDTQMNIIAKQSDHEKFHDNTSHLFWE